jgi:HSP20 family protein
MSLLRWYETEPGFITFNDVARIFDDAVPRRSQATRAAHTFTSGFTPKTDLHEGPDNTVVASLELPGLKKEDVTIELDNDRLTVSGECKYEGEHTEAGYAIRERRFGKFTRTLPLPQGTKPESVKAVMEHGVLTLTFPQAGPEQAPKRVAIA